MDPHWLPTTINNNISQHQTQHPNTNPPTAHNDTLNRRLSTFWQSQRVESEQGTPEFRTHSLPLARIKKIMKSDDNVRMISAETPVLLSKACDIFIQELALRSWVSTETSKRRTLQKSDVSFAVSTSDLFDFLVDIVPREKPATVASLATTAPAGPVLAVEQARENERQVAPMWRVGNDQLENDEVYDDSVFVNGSWPWFSQQSTWPPPHL
ncbi:hypothetical protein vseg_014965 [Gypsophila vaccaria]